MARKRRNKALVLGIGNLLLKDEGAGVRTVALFESDYSFGDDVVCLDGGTSGLGLLSYIKDYTHIVIVDALRAQGPPGSVVRVPKEKLQSAPALSHTSAHQIGLKDLLAIARFEGLDPEISIIGVIPNDMSAGMELTPEVQRALPLATEAIREELERFGFKAARKAA